MIRLGALLCFFLCQISRISAAIFKLDWKIAVWRGISASPGDKVIFNYNSFHDVWIHPTGDCSEDGKIAVGALGASPAQYTFTDADLGTTITFACDVGNHCDSGQLINFNIVATTPSPTALPTKVSSQQPSRMPIRVTVTPSKAPSKVPTLAPSIAPSTPAPTPAPTVAPVTPAPTTAPTTAPVTASPTVAPVTSSPTIAPVTPSPTVAPVTPAPTVAPNTSSPTIAPVTGEPTAAPVTGEPTAAPVTGEPTAAPVTGEPTAAPFTSEPTKAPPTPVPTLALEASAPPSTRPQISTETATNLSQTLVGMTTCDEVCQKEWISVMSTSTAKFFSLLDADADFTVLENEPKLTLIEVPTRRRRLQGAGVGAWVRLKYNHQFEYTSDKDSSVQVDDLAALPLAGEDDRKQFVEALKSRGNVFDDLTGVIPVGSNADTSSPPEDPPLLSRNAIIGIAAGGGVILLALIGFLCCRKKDSGQDGTGPPPDVLKVNHGRDEVSTLGGPDRPYGDQSVATVDYDYSKAYGGGADHSVSEAGGTYGSNNQGLLDPINAGATGGALGGFDTGGSFEDAYRGAGGNVKEDLIHIFAPPGKLGVVIDTPDDGAPVVHAVKDSSIIAEKIHVGDKLVAVDDEDVRAMTAIKVSKLISRKSANPSRKLSIIRTTVIE